MAGPKINLPPYDGTNSVELKEILIGSAAEFRGNLNDNTDSVADAVNLNTTAFSLWTKAWVENIGLIYWNGLQEEGLASGNTQVDVGYMQDIGVLTDIPKLINSYKVSVKYGSGQAKIEFDTHYRDEDGQSVSYIDTNKGINIVINSTQVKGSDNKYHRYINITNTSTASNVRLTMEIDEQSARSWNNTIEQLSLDTLQEITAEGQTQIGLVSAQGTASVNDVHDEGVTQIGNVNTRGNAMISAIEQAGTSRLNVTYVGDQQGRESFEQTELAGAHVYLWLDTGTTSV